MKRLQCTVYDKIITHPRKLHLPKDNYGTASNDEQPGYEKRNKQKTKQLRPQITILK